MQSRLISNASGRLFALVLDQDEEVIQSLLAFAREYNLTACQVTAIGAFSRATLGYFDLERQDYHRIPVEEQVEVLALNGNIALHEDEPKVHAHVVLGKRDGTAVGGHLLEARVRPTLEVMLTEAPDHLRRTFDASTGLPLLSV